MLFFYVAFLSIFIFLLHVVFDVALFASFIQPLRAFRRARVMGCPAWVLGKSSGIWAVLSLPLNQLGVPPPLPWRLGDHFEVLGGSEGVLWRAQGHRKRSPSFSESPLSVPGASWGSSWGGFGGLGCFLDHSWEVRMLLFRWFYMVF